MQEYLGVSAASEFNVHGESWEMFEEKRIEELINKSTNIPVATKARYITIVFYKVQKPGYFDSITIVQKVTKFRKQD